MHNKYIDDKYITTEFGRYVVLDRNPTMAFRTHVNTIQIGRRQFLTSGSAIYEKFDDVGEFYTLALIDDFLEKRWINMFIDGLCLEKRIENYNHNKNLKPKSGKARKIQQEILQVLERGLSAFIPEQLDG